jgi:transposase
MKQEQAMESSTIAVQEQRQPGEQGMVQKERWEEIRRMFFEQRVTVSQIARGLDLDRKTVRRCIRQSQWQPYSRAAKADTLLAEHLEFVRERAAQVNYSARIVYQELKFKHGYRGSYDTVKRAVAPLREVASAGELCLTRFETEPGEQSQIDWGQALVYLASRAVVVHLFVLTLGFSRRGFYYACLNERMSQFLEAHERAFEHFGGHTREHLYDRPRTVCYADDTGKRIWNPTFKAFAQYWGFDPHVCRAYRAQTKGKVESGVKYVKRNFLPGREFVDIVDLQQQLDEWNATIADCRVHGTTHEMPIVRFERERCALVPLAGQPGFGLAARSTRSVARDWLVSFATNRYSVPFQLIGQSVELQRQGDRLLAFHRGELVANHALLAGQHQVSVLPEHGPGAIARNARTRLTQSSPQRHSAVGLVDVEVRDLQVYERLLSHFGAEEVVQ